MQGCNGLSSLRTIRSSYSLRAPLDSTAIDPITRSPNYHHETGKIENLSRANLCLAHGPLELDDDDLDSLKLTIFFDSVGLVKTSKLLPHTLLWASYSSHIFTGPLSPQRTTSFKHLISSWCSTWTCTPQPNPTKNSHKDHGLAHKA